MDGIQHEGHYLNRFSIVHLNRHAELKTDVDAANWLLMQCVVATANIEIHESVFGIPEHSWENEDACPYWKIQRYGLQASRLLGKLVRNKDIDIKSNPLWKLLSETYQSSFIEEMEFWRINEIPYPFLDAIEEAVYRNNVIVTLGVKFTPGDASEGVDDYGNPAWYTKWTAEKDYAKRYCHSCCEDTVKWAIDTARNFNKMSLVDKDEEYFDDN